jgi:hypothetical protein
MWIDIVLITFRIWICNGIKKEIRIRIGIKTMRINNTDVLTNGTVLALSPSRSEPNAANWITSR